MQPPRFWHKPYSLASMCLMPLSWAYGAATAMRLKRGPRIRLDVPVICVGNINMGGTGKTPTVIDLVMRLSAMGKRPCVVSRGYGGSVKGPVMVTPAHSADDVGDEPVLLSGFGPVCVSHDRATGAQMAIAQGADVIVLDDGLQNPALAYDLTITVVDRHVGFGNGRVFPAGPLRERVSRGLARTDIVLAIGTKGDVETGSVPLMTGVLEPLQTGMDWNGLHAYAFAGIGRPEKFFNTLKGLGAKVIETREFGDHQKIPETMLKRLDADAWAKGAQLVTTEKDAARLPKAWQQKVLTLPVRLAIDDDAVLVAKLKGLFSPRTKVEVTDLEAVWEHREETVYPEMFGKLSRGIFPLSADSFQGFPSAQIDPRWLSHGVLEFAPNEKRPSWLYITSGYSNPWETAPEDFNQNEPSGSGVEFAIETDEMSDWAVSFLQKMLAFDMMLTTGQLGDKPSLGLHDRIPLGGPIDGKAETEVKDVILIAPTLFSGGFSLPSGKVDILEFVGITNEEKELCQRLGFDALSEQMLKEGNFPITKLRRTNSLF